MPFLDVVFVWILHMGSDEQWFIIWALVTMHWLSNPLDFSSVTRCEHDKVVSAVNCVLSLIGDRNPDHFFVATQDADLREKLREVSTICRVYLYLYFFKKWNGANTIYWPCFGCSNLLMYFVCFHVDSWCSCNIWTEKLLIYRATLCSTTQVCSIGWGEASQYGYNWV